MAQRDSPLHLPESNDPVVLTYHAMYLIAEMMRRRPGGPERLRTFVEDPPPPQ